MAIVNGEFYDYKRIRAELQAKGHVFKTESDSEILLHLYEENPKDFMSQLRGEFAFVLWDQKRKLTIAGRDRFGIKPLYFARIGGRIGFASEVKSLWKAGLPARWNHQNLYWYLNRQPVETDQTIFAETFQVKPGHILELSGSTITQTPYWDINYPPSDKIDRNKPLETQIHELREILCEAVNLRLQADVPVGVYLSGGIDSSAMAGIAHKYIGSRLRAFTISFDSSEFDKHDKYDEQTAAMETAKQFGIDLNVLRVKQADLAESFKTSLWYSEFPAMSSHGVGKYLLSKATHEQGYRCVLTGEGADEVFGGYSIFFETMLLHNTVGQDPTLIAKLLAQLKENNGIFGPHGSKNPFAAPGSNSGSLCLSKEWSEPCIAKEFAKVQERLGFVPRHWSQCQEVATFHFMKDDYVTQYGGKEPYTGFLNSLDVANQLNGRDALNQELYIYAKTTLGGWILNILADRMEMANSIESRVPMLDHKVVEYAATLPTSSKIKGTDEKYILREAVRPFVTESVFKGKKHGFFTPRKFEKGPLEQLRQDTLRSSKLPTFLDRRKMADLLDQQETVDLRTASQIQNASIYALSVVMLEELFGLT